MSEPSTALGTKLAHVEEEDLELYVMGRLTLDQACAVDAHVSECTLCGEALSGAAVSVRKLYQVSPDCPPVKENRKETRIPTNGSGSLRVLTPFSTGVIEIRIVNVSKSGLGMHVSETLSRGMIVQVQMKNAVILGEVRHCVPQGEQFHVGIVILDSLSV